MMRPLAFFKWCAGTVVGLTLLTAVLTIWADPYRLYGTSVTEGWTEAKPRIYQQPGIARTYQIERVVPKSLLLGNSRVEVGLDPESRSWPSDMAPIFNAGFAGRDLFLSLLMLRESVALSPPRAIMVGVDFQDFLTAPTPPGAPLPPSDPDEHRLIATRNGEINSERWLQVWRDRFTAALTIDAVADSVLTLLDQDPKTSATMTPFGFNPRNEYVLFVERSGYRELFEQRNRAYELTYSRAPKPDFTDPRRIANFRYLQEIMTVAAEHQIPVTLFTYPYHADYLEMLHRLGLWQSFEGWKRALVEVTEEQRRKGVVRLFDFADYNEVTTEKVPPSGDTRSEMRWYWEAGHFKSALGDELVKTMFGNETKFGYVLTAESIEGALASVRANRYVFIPAIDASRGAAN